MKKRSSKNLVFDSWTLLAFLKKEPCFPQVEQLLRRAQKEEIRLFLSLINWGEIYYQILRNFDKNKAEEVLEIIEQLPLEIMDVNRELVKIAAAHKAKGRLSYADCFVIATAEVMKGTIVTGDPEFKKLKPKVNLFWIGS